MAKLDMKELWDNIPLGTSDIDPPKMEDVCRDMFLQEKKVRLRRRMSAVALAVVALLSVGGSLFISSKHKDVEPIIAMVQESTHGAEVRHISLPDGSSVWLNSNSALSYPSTFASTREVTLQGEAFFDVAKMDGKRFVVNAGDAKIEVLGTRFDVDAYQNKSIRTTLVGGSVKFVVGEEAVLMTPGQMVDYMDGQIVVKDVETRSSETWKDGLFVMDDMPLPDALRMIGNHFGVDFSISNPSLDDLRFNGSFTFDSLDEILGFFEASEPLTFRLAAPDFYQVL